MSWIKNNLLKQRNHNEPHVIGITNSLLTSTITFFALLVELVVEQCDVIERFNKS